MIERGGGKSTHRRPRGAPLRVEAGNFCASSRKMTPRPSSHTLRCSWMIWRISSTPRSADSPLSATRGSGKERPTTRESPAKRDGAQPIHTSPAVHARNADISFRDLFGRKGRVEAALQDGRRKDLAGRHRLANPCRPRHDDDRGPRVRGFRSETQGRHGFLVGRWARGRRVERDGDARGAGGRTVAARSSQRGEGRPSPPPAPRGSPPNSTPVDRPCPSGTDSLLRTFRRARDGELATRLRPRTHFPTSPSTPTRTDDRSPHRAVEVASEGEHVHRAARSDRTRQKAHEDERKRRGPHYCVEKCAEKCVEKCFGGPGRSRFDVAVMSPPLARWQSGASLPQAILSHFPPRPFNQVKHVGCTPLLSSLAGPAMPPRRARTWPAAIRANRRPSARTTSRCRPGS